MGSLIKFKRTKNSQTAASSTTSLQYGEPLANFADRILKIGGHTEDRQGLTFVASEAGGNGTFGLKYKLVYSTSNQSHAYWICEGFADSSIRSTAIRIADAINNIPVEEIAKDAFKSCGLTSVRFPGKLKRINSGAFYNCWISKVNIPHTIEYIGDSAFGADSDHYGGRFMLPTHFTNAELAEGGGIFSNGSKLKYRRVQCDAKLVKQLAPHIGCDPNSKNKNTVLTICSAPLHRVDEEHREDRRAILSSFFDDNCSNITHLFFDDSLEYFGAGALQHFTRLQELRINATYAILSAEGSRIPNELVRQFFGTLFATRAQDVESNTAAEIYWRRRETAPQVDTETYNLYFSSDDIESTLKSDSFVAGGLWCAPEYTLQCRLHEPVTYGPFANHGITESYAPLWIYKPNNSNQLIFYGTYFSEADAALRTGAFIYWVKDGKIAIDGAGHMVGEDATEYISDGLNSCCRIPSVLIKADGTGFTPSFDRFLYRIPLTLKTLVVPNGSLYANCFMNMRMLEKLEFPANESIIPSNCCYGCSSLRSTNLAELTNLKEIKDGAFYACDSLISVSLPENLQTLDNRVFMQHQVTANYNWLRPHITRDSSSGRWYLDKYCKPNACFVGSNPREVDPDEPKTWERYPYTHTSGHLYTHSFDRLDYYNLNFFGSSDYRGNFDDFAQWLTQWRAPTISRKRSGVYGTQFGLRSIKLNNKLQRIGAQAFSQCFNLQSIDFPDSVREVGEHAFQECISLSTITLGDSTSTASISFGGYCFIGCHSLEYLKLKSSRSISFGYRCFARCYNLKEVWFNIEGNFYPNSAAFRTGGAFAKDSPRTHADASRLWQDPNDLATAMAVSAHIVTRAESDSSASDAGYIFRNITHVRSRGAWALGPDMFYQCPQLDAIATGYDVRLASAWLSETYSTDNGYWKAASSNYICPIRACLTYSESIASAAFRGCRNLRYCCAPNCAEISDEAFKATPCMRYFYASEKLDHIFYGPFTSNELYKTDTNDSTNNAINTHVQLVFETYAKVTNPICTQEFRVERGGNDRLLTDQGKAKRGSIAVQLVYDHFTSGTAGDSSEELPRFINKNAQILTTFTTNEGESAQVVTDVTLTKGTRTLSGSVLSGAGPTMYANGDDEPEIRDGEYQDQPLNNRTVFSLETWGIDPTHKNDLTRWYTGVGKLDPDLPRPNTCNRMRLTNMKATDISGTYLNNDTSITVTKQSLSLGGVSAAESTVGYALLPRGASFVHWIYSEYNKLR